MAVAQGVEGRPLIRKEGAQLALYSGILQRRRHKLQCKSFYSVNNVK